MAAPNIQFDEEQIKRARSRDDRIATSSGVDDTDGIVGERD
jgi:hypothetical protein